MAWADAVSIVRELGIREPGETGTQALPSTANHAASYSPRCAEVGNHQKNWLAYFSSHVFDAASIYRCGIENHEELLRHSTIRVTLDTYTQAVTTEKRTAQDAVVALLCPQKMQ